MRSFKLLSYKQDTPQLEEVCMAQMRGYYSCTCNVYISIYIGHLFRFSLVIWQLCMHCLEFCQPLLLRQKCLSSLSLVQTLSCERNVACVKNNPIVTLPCVCTCSFISLWCGSTCTCNWLLDAVSLQCM